MINRIMTGKKEGSWIKKKKEIREKFTPIEIFEGIQEGNFSVLGMGITLVESQNQSKLEDANELVQLCLAKSGKSIRIAITGVPGVGKSTFIESLGLVLTKKGHKVAVLAVDPSSSLSQGSILGDKTRMQNLSVNENVFIRPSPAGTTLGGVSRKTRESILLCEAAGFDVILIETVGVGQSETVVKSMVDCFVLLMLAGAGDELQGIKKGIMEMADIVLINKADGDNVQNAKLAAQEYSKALHLFPAHSNGWTPKVLTCSAVENINIEELSNLIDEFKVHTQANGSFSEKRKNQEKMWMVETLKELILNDYFKNDKLMAQMKNLENSVMSGEMSAHKAAKQLYEQFKNGEDI